VIDDFTLHGRSHEPKLTEGRVAYYARACVAQTSHTDYAVCISRHITLGGDSIPVFLPFIPCIPVFGGIGENAPRVVLVIDTVHVTAGVHLIGQEGGLVHINSHGVRDVVVGPNT
jgi:hypothetical protein